MDKDSIADCKKELEQLISGVFRVSFEELLSWSPDLPIIAGEDYFQGTGDNADSYSLIIRKGGNFNRGRKLFKQVLEERQNPNIPSQKKKIIADEYGVVKEELSIDLRGEGASFMVGVLQEALKKSFSKVTRDPITHSMPKKVRNSFQKTMQKLQRMVQERELLTFLFFLHRRGIQVFDRTIRRTVLCGLLIGYHRINQPVDERIIRGSIFLSALDLFDLMEEEAQTESELKERLESLQDLLKALDVESEMVGLIKRLYMNLAEAKTMTPHKILQVSNSLDCYIRGSNFLIGSELISPSPSKVVESIISEMVSQSNPKVNENNPAPLYPEQTISYLANLLGFSHLIERERQIRSEILAKCEHSACVINRVSVACNHRNLTGKYILEHPFCDGQGSDIHMIGNAGRGPYLPKCQNGSEILSRINLRMRQMRQENE